MSHTLPMTYHLVVIKSNIEVTQGQRVEQGQFFFNFFGGGLSRKPKRKSETDTNLGSHIGYNG